MRRSAGPNTLTPDQWRAQLDDFDWVILAVPATAETDGMIGADELAAMKNSATLINIARGSVVDQDALVTALQDKQIANAFLDVTTPEPLPADHPLWSLDNAHITMHLSGRAQDRGLPAAQAARLGGSAPDFRRSAWQNARTFCPARGPIGAW